MTYGRARNIIVANTKGEAKSVYSEHMTKILKSKTDWPNEGARLNELGTSKETKARVVVLASQWR